MRLAAKCVEILNIHNRRPYFFDSTVGTIGVVAISPQDAQIEAMAALGSVLLSGKEYDYAIFRPAAQKEAAHGVR
jgi:hypothetical protein